ncbi:MAG: DUF4172 domain-containing protein [Tannerella sp.]|jgi:Fic family protein|nr:DUF4172 domain-containing protein [Tannerella sp.]
MKKAYIWELGGWPYLTWDSRELSPLLGEVRNRQGLLAGRTGQLDDGLKKKALLDSVVADIMASARIEGKTLNEGQVIITAGISLSRKKFHLADTDDADVGATTVYIDTLYNYAADVTAERLFRWKCALEGKPFSDRASAERYKTENLLPSPPAIPAERKIEYLKAPVPPDTAAETESFLKWLNTAHPTDPVIKAGVACLRFLLIRPFDDDNGRMARTLSNIFLARADNIGERYYSISAGMEKNRRRYNDILSATLTGSLDITEWLRQFLHFIESALTKAEDDLTFATGKLRFLEKCKTATLNERQLKMMNRLWDERDLRLSSTTWAADNDCSSDTALRDIQDLVTKKILRKENAGGRSTAYRLNRDLQ